MTSPRLPKYTICPPGKAHNAHEEAPRVGVFKKHSPEAIHALSSEDARLFKKTFYMTKGK